MSNRFMDAINGIVNLLIQASTGVLVATLLLIPAQLLFFPLGTFASLFIATVGVAIGIWLTTPDHDRHPRSDR